MKQQTRQSVELVVLGAGPAGLSAGIYATRYGLTTLIIGRDQGLIAEAVEVENYLGIYPIAGVELVTKFTTHAQQLGLEIVYDEVVKLEFDTTSKVFKTTTANGSEYISKVLIYALGCSKRKLGIPEEAKFVGKGISYCAVCDAPLYKNKYVAVVGGGNSAVQSALLLTEFATKVYLIYRRNRLKALPTLLNRLTKIEEAGKIEVIYNTIIEALEATDNRLTALKVRTSNSKEAGSSYKLKVEGVFVEIGYEPNTKLAKKLGVKLALDGRIVVDDNMTTNIQGLFAAGDVTTGSAKLDQVVTAVAEGAIAATSAYKYLRELTSLSN